MVIIIMTSIPLSFSETEFNAALLQTYVLCPKMHFYCFQYYGTYISVIKYLLVKVSIISKENSHLLLKHSASKTLKSFILAILAKRGVAGK
jgi:hypothetical protein